MTNFACPGCDGGFIDISSTKTVGFRRTQYLVCSDRCGWRAKKILQLDAAGRIISPSFLQRGINADRAGQSGGRFGAKPNQRSNKND